MKVLQNVREKSLRWLSNELKAENDLIEQGFSLVRLQIDSFNRLSHKEQKSNKGVFARVCNAGLGKAHRLLIGIHDLNLLGLAQEGGGLLRPAIEATELLVYFNQDPSRAYQAAWGDLPSAGNIAKTISGKLMNVRKYLNEHASHFSFTEESLGHVVDSEKILTVADPDHSISVFRANVLNTLIFQHLLLSAGASSLRISGLEIEKELPGVMQWDVAVRKMATEALELEKLQKPDEAKPGVKTS